MQKNTLEIAVEMKETRQLEFKADVTNTFLKTVSAYANYDGGQIRFGVADDGKVIGLANPMQVYNTGYFSCKYIA